MSYIQQQYRDTHIIPDRFNTGCDESLLTPCITQDGYMQDFYWKLYNKGTTLGFSFSNPNNAGKVGTTITISNIDFTTFPLVQSFDNSNVDVDTYLIFENCKFNELTLIGSEYLHIEVNDCTAKELTLTYTDAHRCLIGGSYIDGLRVFHHSTIEDSYIRDLCYWSKDSYHSDGIQIYGKTGEDCVDIFLNNCRFEVVSYPVYKHDVLSSSYINACIMLQLEASSGNNIHFDHCVVNGGNYTCYSWVIPDVPYTLTNVSFDDCQFGYSDTLGLLYTRTDPNTEFNDCFRTNKLYVGSIWKDSNNDVHISVTNDTLTDRTLWVRTEDGLKKYYIPHSFSQKIGYDEYHTDEGASFWDYPIDMDFNIGKTDYVVCYDDSVRPENQIRYISFNGTQVEEIIVDEPCKPYALYNRYRNMLPPKDANNVVYFNPLWEIDEYTTTQTDLRFGNVSNGHTYRVTGTFTYTVDSTSSSSVNQYIRLRTRNNGCFNMISIALDKITLNSGIVTKTIEFSQDIEATKDDYYGLLNVYADGLSFKFNIENIRIEEIS